MIRLAKAVALFIDGTTNSKNPASDRDRPDAALWTNVAILSEWIDDSIPPGNAERYLKGVGSDELNGGIALQARVHNIFGKYFGYGLTGKVQEAYRQLCTYYRQGYSIFLFGFSRGACAARVLAGFVDEVGLLLEDKLDRVEEAWNIYVRSGDVDASDLRGYLCQVNREYVRPSAENGNQLPIHFLGVWDSVAMWITVDGAHYDPTSRVTRVPSNVSHARHAFAIHEVRRYFPELPWTALHPSAKAQSVKQVWFPGNHADVGGGSGHEDQSLARNALSWMMKEACSVGLPVDVPASASTWESVASPTIHDQSHRDVPHGSRPLVGVRGTLFDWLTFEDGIRFKMSVDAFYLERVANGQALRFEDGIPKKTLVVMTNAANAAIRLQLQRPYVIDGLAVPPWIEKQTAASVSGCANLVRSFVSNVASPSVGEVESFARSMLLWALLCAQRAWESVDETVRAAVQPGIPTNHDEMRSLAGFLERLGVARQRIEAASASAPPSVWSHPFDQLNEDIIQPGWDTYYKAIGHIPTESDIVMKTIRIKKQERQTE